MNVFLLGSCRIHRPMRQLDRSGQVTLLNKVDPVWFMHTARAARQSLEVICNLADPPLHLRELIYETDDEREIEFRAPEMVRQADAIVVEVCSIKSIDLEGWEMNAHRMRSAQINGDPRAEACTRTTSTASEIAAEIRKISEISGKDVMVVNHISVTGQPNLDRARSRVTRVLESARDITPFHLFDTAPVLDQVPVETALKDQNHYAPDFELAMGEAMLAHLKRLPA